jgi:chemotaxis protein methyltransferase CheR
MEIQDKDVKDFQNAIAEYSPYDFSGYSVNSLKRRLEKISEEYDSSIDRLIRTISKDPLALEEVIKKITVNTTELFRDPRVWNSILHHLLPRFTVQSTLHIWHAGCSTGQEVYSMMILLDQLNLLEQTKIYASDINTDVLEKAEQGSYRLRFNREYIDNYKKIFEMGQDDLKKQSYAPYDKYLKINESKDLIQMHDYLCKKPVFKKIDLVKDDNLFFINFDIIICRNVIIYFDYELQNKVLKLFHRNLRNNGCLILGLHESIIGPMTNLYTKEDNFYIKRKD